MACAASLACALALAPAADAAKGKRPNIVVVQIDDAPRHAVNPRTMPNVFRKIVGRGIDFTNAMTTTPLCCPSRMSLLTGQYAHNHNVTTNFYPRLVGKRNTLPVWLSRKGYRTAHIGKYANGYWRGKGKDTRPAPGWTDWYTSAGKDSYYNHQFSINGKRRKFGSNPRSHQTRVVTRYATKVINKHFRKRRAGSGKQKRKTNQPLYLQADYYAPHGGSGGNGRCSSATAVPLPGDQGKFEGAPLPKPPSFDEADVSDKPSFMQEVPSLTDESITRLSIRYRCVLESLVGVDRGVKKILKTLKKKRALGNTVVVFLNDNGFFFGEHRLASRFSSDQGGKWEPKVVPYEEAYRVPLFVRAPKRLRGGRAGAQQLANPVANIDLAPTFLDLARARPCRGKRGKRCRVLDGTSLAPLIAGASSRPSSNRALVVEYRGRGNLPTCKYAGLVFTDETFVVHDEVRLGGGGCQRGDDGDIEHYRLNSDPWQLHNLYPESEQPGSPNPALAARQAQLRTRLNQLRNCAGSPTGGGKTGRFRCE